MYKLQDLNKLPEDIVRYIFLFDNTYHEHFRIVLKELKHVTRLLRIVLETRFSSHKSINGIVLFEHRDITYLNEIKPINAEISQLYWKYFLINKY